MKYYSYCRGLNKNEIPDYEYLKNLFINLHQKKFGDIDWVFDWNNLYNK